MSEPRSLATLGFITFLFLLYQLLGSAKYRKAFASKEEHLKLGNGPGAALAPEPRATTALEEAVELPQEARTLVNSAAAGRR